MKSSKVVLAIALGAGAAIGCAGGNKCGGEERCNHAGSSSYTGEAGRSSPQQPASTSLLGDAAAMYSEAQEASNGASMNGEPTGYVLETEQGLGVAGSFESATPTPDSFIFNSGALGTPSKPGFPGVNIQVLVDGQALNGGVSLSLDSVQEFGYSSLSGNYFKNAALISGKDYVLRVNPSATLAGKNYTLEIRGNVVQK